MQSRTSHPVLAVLLGGGIAATLDIVYAFISNAQWGYSPLGVLQIVASGWLGKPAFTSGLAGGLLGGLVTAAGTTLIALFNASATPEREVHGAFLALLAAQAAGAEGVFALIDESALSARWHGERARLSERRAAWTRMSEEASVAAVFVDLAAPDLVAAENAIERAITAVDR